MQTFWAIQGFVDGEWRTCTDRRDMPELYDIVRKNLAELELADWRNQDSSTVYRLVQVTITPVEGQA